MANVKVKPIQIQKISLDTAAQMQDLLAVEEPLEIRIGYGPENDRQQQALAVTMRTPGHDEELAMGFLFTEGIITSKNDILSIKYCVDTGKQLTENVLRVELQPEVTFDPIKLQRNFYTTSSCGVCGKASIEALQVQACAVSIQSDKEWASTLIRALPGRLRAAQAVFKHTGGLHASALFSPSGELLILREDIGRHNALDKLIGAAMERDLLPLDDHLVLLSGRIGFELVQKSVMASVPMLVAIGAPSSLAASVAEEFGITLIGFLKQDRFNVYAHPQRVKFNRSIAQ